MLVGSQWGEVRVVCEGCSGCKWLFDVRAGVSDGCCSGLFEPAVECIQVAGQLMVLSCVSCSWLCPALFSTLTKCFLCSPPPPCYFNISQCVSGLVIQDSVPASVGLLLTPAKLPEFSHIVVSAEGFS